MSKGGVRRGGWGGEIDMVLSGLGGVGRICWVRGWIWRGRAVDRGGGAEGWWYHENVFQG